MGTSYRVLVVDDDEGVTKLIASLLSKFGHRCETTRDGLEALERMKEGTMEAAVVDIVMPRMDGIALTRELVSLYPGFPIMIMTAHADEDSAGSAIAAGAREFIKKPFSVNEFILRFNKMMRDREGEQALLALSLTDELTGLYNRRRFLVLAEQSLKLAIRMKTRLLLFYIDMDGLKWINDTHGHREGDQALIVLAGIIKKTFRESDIIARIGGDEFVVLLKCDDDTDEMLTERLYRNIKNYNDEASKAYELSVSTGVARFDPGEPVSIEELLSGADALMYTRKRKGGKRNPGSE